VDIENNEFSFLVGVQVDKPTKFDGLELITIPASKYIVFERIGPMPASLNRFKYQIFSDWFPISEKKVLNTAEIEFYHFGDTQNTNGKFEYWISIS
jgi:AraC family transcriptional regulator